LWRPQHILTYNLNKLQNQYIGIPVSGLTDRPVNQTKVRHRSSFLVWVSELTSPDMETKTGMDSSPDTRAITVSPWYPDTYIDNYNKKYNFKTVWLWRVKISKQKLKKWNMLFWYFESGLVSFDNEYPAALESG